jgi:hypothetical protein
VCLAGRSASSTSSSSSEGTGGLETKEDMCLYCDQGESSGVSVRCGKLGRGGSVQPRALPSARRDNWSDNAQPQSQRHNLGSGQRAKIKYTVIILRDARSCFGFRPL